MGDRERVKDGVVCSAASLSLSLTFEQFKFEIQTSAPSLLDTAHGSYPTLQQQQQQRVRICL